MNALQDVVDSLVRAVPSPQSRIGGIGVVDPGDRVEWSSIGGLSEVKTQLQKAIEWPIRYPEAFARLGLRRSKGRTDVMSSSYCKIRHFQH